MPGRRSTLGVALVLLGCTHGAAPPNDEHAAVPTREANEVCTEASIMVAEAMANASAVDPVETRREILLSRSFESGAPAALEPKGRMHVERVGRSAVLKIRIDGDPSRSKPVCEWVLAHATAPDASATWLKNQVDEARMSARTAEVALLHFDQVHGLCGIPLQVRRESLARTLLELDQKIERTQTATLRERRERLQGEAIELDRVELERSRIKQQVEVARKELASVLERLLRVEVDNHVAPAVRVLDSCAPCAP